MVKIKLIEKSNLKSIIPIVCDFNTSISREKIEVRLESMIEEGYECLGCYDNDVLVGVCGLWMQTRFYSGSVIEPDNVYIKKEYQSIGLGSKVMDAVYELGRERGCDVVELNCYVDNDQGNYFWKKKGFIALGYHYLKKLKQ